MNNAILIGFDRSGTSAISRSLAMHPDIELIFRPFNSGSLRKKMYEILDDKNISEEDLLFFEKLQQEELYSDYFVSEWHLKYSTVKTAFKPGKFHLMITNINHFSIRWVSQNFPRIEQWGIWRDPIDILNSCVKNKFYGSWYEDALSTILISVEREKSLAEHFGDYIDLVKCGNDVIKTAFLLAVRNYFLFANINPCKVINYEVFKTDANSALKHFLKYFKLNEEFDFNPFLDQDLNSIASIDGYKKNKSSKNVLSRDEELIANELFNPLYNIYEERHQGGEVLRLPYNK